MTTTLSFSSSSTLSKSGIFLLQPFYSSLHKPQTPQSPGLQTLLELVPHNQPALSSGSSVLIFCSSHMLIFHGPLCPDFRWLVLWFLFPVGCLFSLDLLSLGLPWHLLRWLPHTLSSQLCTVSGVCPQSVFLQCSLQLSLAVHHLCPPSRHATQWWPALHFTIFVNRFG